MKCLVPGRRPLSRLHRTSLFVGICHFFAASALASTPSAGIRVQGSGVTPQLMFACCDQGVGQTQSLFADPRVFADLKDLHAGLGVAIVDFTPQRAELVRRLNRDGIPVIAGLGMPPGQGSYFNAELERYATPARPEESVRQTFCGT